MLDTFTNMENVVHFLLILFRVMGIFVVAPLLGNRSVPVVVKVAMSIGISFILLPFVPMQGKPNLSQDLWLIIMVVKEVSVGVVLGFASLILFESARVAGELFGLKIGFGLAQVVDPSNEGSSSLMANFYLLIGAMLFLYLNGHHVMIVALFQSFKILPLETGFSLDVGYGLVDLLTKMIAVALKMAAPLIVVISILNIAMGILTKLAPQLNIYFSVGMVVGPTIGIVVLMISLPVFRALMGSMASEMPADLTGILMQMRGTP